MKPAAALLVLAFLVPAGCGSPGARVPDPAPRASCSRECPLLVENRTGRHVDLVAEHLLRAPTFLGFVAPNSSQSFAVPRELRWILVEIDRQVVCRGAIEWSPRRTARLSIGPEATCRTGRWMPR